MLSISQIVALTRSQAATWLKNTLSALGFQTTGWQPGRNQQMMLNNFATSAAAFSQVSATLVEAGFSSTSFGSALTLYSRSRFDNERTPAVKTAGPFLLTSTSAVPNVIAVGQLVVTDSNGVEFSNTSGDTLAAGGTVDLDFEATLAGSAGNIGNDSTLTLLTPLAGVTVTNPGPGGLVDWYTITAGADEESDAELQRRNATKWGLLSVERTATAIEYLALGCDGVSKALVVATNPRGQNTTDVYVSGADSLISTAEIEAVQEAFSEYTMGTETVWPPTEIPMPSQIWVKHPAELELSLIGTVYYDPQFTLAEVQASILARVTAMVQAVPIGGKRYATGAANLLTFGDIFQTIEGSRGVLTVLLTTPSDDITIPSTTLLTQPSSLFGGLSVLPGVTS
jgi:uncharacterized phage protein gp47/JayE